MIREIKILGDKETKADKLNFSPYVGTLVSIVENVKIMPYTIGVFGEWGSGKTSFMRMMEAELEKNEEYLTVWFNAWKYRKQEEIWTSLFETIAAALRRDKRISSTITTKLNDLLKGADYMKLMSCLGKLILTRSVDFQGFIESLRKEKLLESIMEFEKRFSDILEDSKIEKLIIFIDDLDRCLNENVINIMESIKLFLNSERCIFVLGIDKVKIERAVAVRYKEEYSKENASEYIKKIIQLPFNLPSLRFQDILHFMESLKIDREARELVEEVITTLDRNPREIKRFLDILTFRRLLMENIEKAENVKLDQKIMVTLLVMEYRFPEFYRDLVNSFDETTSKSSILEDIEEYLLLEDPKEKEKKLETSVFLKEHCKNVSLLDFLKDKKISDINLEPYLFIAFTASAKELRRSKFEPEIGTIGIYSLIRRHLREKEIFKIYEKLYYDLLSPVERKYVREKLEKEDDVDVDLHVILVNAANGIAELSELYDLELNEKLREWDESTKNRIRKLLGLFVVESISGVNLRLLPIPM